jgi:hypothetical protein
MGNASLWNSHRCRELIAEYGRLQALDGFTPQSRGQRLNGFIADLFRCWGIDAVANTRSNGEIDTAFQIGDRHFVLEAKWEKERTATGPLSKLQKRLRQRLGGTIGVFLSMAGFTREALSDLTVGEQLMVLCLTQRHLEAMLSGLIPPEELIGACVTKASREGVSYVELEDLFDYPRNSEESLRFGPPVEIKTLIDQAAPGFSASVVVSDFSLSSMGLAELSPGRLLFPSAEGLVLVDLVRQTVQRWLQIKGWLSSVLVHPNGTVYFSRCAGVGCVRQGQLQAVGGGATNIRAFLGADGSVWGYWFDDHQQQHLSAIRLASELGNQTPWAVGEFSRGTKQVGAPVHFNGETLLLAGLSGLELVGPEVDDVLVEGPWKGDPMVRPNPTRIDQDRFVVACNSQELWELNVRTRVFHRLVKFRHLNLSVCLLATSVEGGGYLSCSYLNGQSAPRGIVVKWHYPLNNVKGGTVGMDSP